MTKRQIIGPPVPPPPGPALRLSKIAIPRQYKNNISDTPLDNIERYTFSHPNDQILSVFNMVQNCGIALPSIFGPITTLNEFQQDVIRSYYYSFRVLLFYHYRKGGTLESVIKHRENILILDSNINIKTVVWQFSKSEDNNNNNNFANRWHFLYHENKKSNKLIIFRDIRTLLLNDYAKYITSLLNISTETSIQLLTMIFYKTLSCSENSFLKLIKTLFSSLSNYYLSLLSQIAVGFVSKGKLPIETLRKLVDRWFPIFISQETPHVEKLFVQMILSSPDQLTHLHTPSISENCKFCSDSLLFLLSLIRITRQFLSIIEKYKQASKIAFTLFITLAKDERFGESSLMLRAEATNAVVQLWLSSAKSHILTLDRGIIQTLGEICRLQTIQINVWRSLIEDCIEDSEIKLLDLIISNENTFDDLSIYRELYNVDYTLNMDLLYTLFSRLFLRPYCIKELDQIETNYYLGPLIVNYLTKIQYINDGIKESICTILVKLLCEMTDKSPLAYLFSARLSLFIPWISHCRSIMIKLGIRGLFTDELDNILQSADYLNNLPDNHIHDLNGSKIFYLTLPEFTTDDPQRLKISRILYGVMETDNNQGLALLDFLSYITIHYYPSPILSHLSLILSMYIELDQNVKNGDTIPINSDNKNSECNIISIISYCLGVKRVLITLKGLECCGDEINKSLEYILSKNYPISPKLKVMVNIQCDPSKSKMDNPYLKLVLKHLLEFYIDRKINAKYYRLVYLTDLSINYSLSENLNLNDENIGTVTPELHDVIMGIYLNVDNFHDIPTFLNLFIQKLISGTDINLDNTNSESGTVIGFYEYVNIMADKFNEINFDDIFNTSNNFDRIGKIITSHFIANIIAIHLFGHNDESYTRFTTSIANKYTLSQVINCLVHKNLTSDEILPFLMNETEFKDLVGDHESVSNVVIYPFNMLTNNIIDGNNYGSIGLLKWNCDWILLCAKITSSMAILGSNKANSILNKIEKHFHGSLISKISINDKRDLRVSTLLPYNQLDLALTKIADFLQATNNVEYVCAAMNILWSLVISSIPRPNLVSPLIKILLTVNSQMNNPHMMNFQANNLNKLASLVAITFLLWITADPLQSIISFAKVSPSGSPSSVISWRSIEKFVKVDMKNSTNLECRFNEVNLQFSEFSLPLAHKIFMGDLNCKI